MRLIPGKHPDVAVQKDFINEMETLIEHCETNGESVYYFDPMHLLHNARAGYIWQEKGKTKIMIMLSNTGRRRINILGAISPITLLPTIMLTEANCDQYSISEFLKMLRAESKSNSLIYIFLDNAPYNKSYLVRDVAKELNIVLKFLPPYSPNLNLTERLWKFSKKKLVYNRYYSTFKEFEQACFDFFANIGNYSKEMATLITRKFEIIYER